MTKTGMYKANKFRHKDIENPKEDKDYFLGRLGEYFIFLKDRALFVGSAPHFTFRIYKTKKQFFDMTFLDTFSFFKGSLANVAKELKLKVEKMERQLDIGKVDYRLIPDDNEDKIYFTKYAKVDSRVTQQAGEAIRQLHIHAGMKKFRVSSPSFAIQFVYKQLTDSEVIVNGVENQEIMQLILDTYRGGRTGGIAHGRVENISVLDFASSYPTAMLSIPSFSPSMQYVQIPSEMLEDDLSNIIEEIQKNPNCFMRVSGIETDAFYPSLIAHNKQTKKLTPIYGEFTNIATTGYELLVGINSGTLHISKIHELVFLVDTDLNVKSPFRLFAIEAYHGKQNQEKGTILYQMWKLVLNGAYGKLIESRKKVHVSVEHEEDLIPYTDDMEQEIHILFLDEYLRCMRDEQNWEDTYLQLCEQIHKSFPADEIKYCAFSDINIGGKDFGTHAVPAAASLITGIARARLRALMKCTSALYWDTDSVFIPNLDFNKLTEYLNEGNKWLPKNIHPLQMGDQLGDLDCEMQGGTGYLAGTKRYYLWKDTGELDENNQPIIKIKKAIHGLPALPKEEIERMIKYLATNEGIGEYFMKEKPLKSKEAPNARLIGAFKAKEKAIRSLYQLDNRLNWEYNSHFKMFIGKINDWKKFNIH
jgi:hypothetical protein